MELVPDYIRFEATISKELSDKFENIEGELEDLYLELEEYLTESYQQKKRRLRWLYRSNHSNLLYVDDDVLSISIDCQDVEDTTLMKLVFKALDTFAGEHLKFKTVSHHYETRGMTRDEYVDMHSNISKHLKTTGHSSPKIRDYFLEKSQNTSDISREYFHNYHYDGYHLIVAYEPGRDTKEQLDSDSKLINNMIKGIF